jgi:hypothetical protein
MSSRHHFSVPEEEKFDDFVEIFKFICDQFKTKSESHDFYTLLRVLQRIIRSGEQRPYDYVASKLSENSLFADYSKWQDLFYHIR